MIDNCINTSLQEYKDLLEYSGLSPMELNYYIRKFQEKTNNLDKFPPLETLLNIKNTTYYNKSSRDTIIEDVFEGSLKEKNKRENLFESTQQNVQKTLQKIGISGTSVELVQYLNNRYPDIRISRIGSSIKGNIPYIVFKLENMATINNDKNPEYMDQSSLLSSLITDDNYNSIVESPIFSIGNWNVIPYKNKNIVIKGIPTNYSEFKELKSYSETEAIQVATDNFNKEESFTTNLYRDIVLNKETIRKIFNTDAPKIALNGYPQRIKLNNIEVYNLELPDYTLNPALKEVMELKEGKIFIKSDISRDQIFDSIMGTNQAEKYVYSQLVINGYDINNIKNILDTNDKLLVFNLLKAKYYLDNYEVYDRVSKIANVKARGSIIIDASLHALNTIQNTSPIKLKVTRELSTKGNFAVLTKLGKDNFKFITKNKVNTEQSNMVYLLDKLSTMYGFNYKLITTNELNQPQWKSVIKNPEVRNAFIYNGEVYINTDNASLQSPIHELTHLILGSIKHKKPEIYYSLVNKIYELPDYKNRAARYSELTESDKNEEIFTEIFSDYTTNTLLRTDVNNWILENSGDFNVINYESKRIIDELLDPDTSITKETSSRLFSMKLNDVMDEFGSSLRLGQFSEIIDNDMSKSTRQLKNLKSRLLQDNKLKENCY